ncbi:MAG: DUF2911 domain-containing protein [Myxococcota bacterium]
MTFVVSMIGWFAGSAQAQELALPALSPAAQVMQHVGLVDLTVTYSSPGKRGRTIWGELVPYGEVWRTGANAATAFETTGDVTIGGTLVPAGKYAVFTIPGKDEWTLILNKGAEQWGAFEYDKTLDVVQVKVAPTAGPDRERMTFLFSDTDEDSTSLDLEWAGVHVSLPIAVETAGQVTKNIDTFVEDTRDGLATAARYKLEHEDYAGALKLIDTSLAVGTTWYNTWLKADILHHQDQHKAAYKLATEALALGTAAGDDFFWKDRVVKAVAEWKKK